MRTEANSGTVVTGRDGCDRRSLRGTGHEARAVVAALVLAAGIAAAGFVAGYSTGPLVYGQMPELRVDHYLVYVTK